MTNRALICDRMYDKTYRNDDLKLCFLWYDELLINNIAYNEKEYFSKFFTGLSKKDTHVLTDIFTHLSKLMPRDILYHNTELDRRGYPRWESDEYYTYPEPQNSEEYAHNYLLRKFKKDGYITDEYTVELAEGSARVAVDAVSIWEKVNLDYPCMLQASENEKSAMIAMREYNLGLEKTYHPFKLFELIVPELSNVSWKRIIELKKEGRVNYLRDKIEEISSVSGDDLNEAKNTLKEKEEFAFEEIIENSKPNLRKVSFESVLSNIPCIPIINPAGLFLGAKSIRNEIEKANKYNWIYALRDLNKLKNS